MTNQRHTTIRWGICSELPVSNKNPVPDVTVSRLDRCALKFTSTQPNMIEWWESQIYDLIKILL